MNAERFRLRAAELVEYCREHGYNTRIALLWDLSMHSGRRRLALWNFDEDRAEHIFVASHGSGSRRAHVPSAYARASNVDGSHLSSEGRALIGERYEGRYGTAYRLDGLDDTDSALRARCVVLHGWRYTPSFAVWPLPAVGSWGCPAVSRHAMTILDRRLRDESKVVLWAFFRP
ncbi:hypothetical protein D1647_00465 [Alistipes sp. Z76]|nr:hypothetical protein [Alistipes sp. Z76]NCE66868.1 hypothetical protein [Muribaculaceae bacterium M3]